MGLQVIDADVDALDHVEEVCLQDEGLPGVVEHPCGMFELLEILQSFVDGDGHVQ